MTVNEFYQKVDGDYTDAINRLQSDVLIRISCNRGYDSG